MNPEDLPIEDRTETEVYTRVMGYHRPISCANVGKQQEHRDRKFFTEKQVDRFIFRLTFDRSLAV